MSGGISSVVKAAWTILKTALVSLLPDFEVEVGAN